VRAVKQTLIRCLRLSKRGPSFSEDVFEFITRHARPRLQLEMRAGCPRFVMRSLILVHAANIQDRDGAVDVLKAIR
jgi:hypothetical protein